VYATGRTAPLADPDMGGQAGCPHGKNRGFLLFKYLTFGPFCMEIDEKHSALWGFAPDPIPGALSLDPAGGSAPRYPL